ncbi:hypothetical protein PHYSODRAFT_307351 [Phytophthora sojae]|uniref:RING-type domain-containing protein n=1 Tax=Phytophthora sojae (strain P6497) TaxID=1094619 RepID=G5AE13_PHYSP|nr:hypothetical protein PHYSODRAFT_307351 [Phytophthora sojae]EGZ06415.1 hypothetical protein PHYSODRAFT_307351 [Phytophthora sojae]|eukprot:XP_009538312.1 hypothetical protein PHYSODRAFT_307351 [Phytophthora sojae]
MLLDHVSPVIPLLVHVSSVVMATGFVYYKCTVSSLTSKKTWSVFYRYSEFDTFRRKVENHWTCHASNCLGSCQAVREVVHAYFPKKRLPFMSSFQSVMTSRKIKFEVVLTHLLRCVLLPGSAMKCPHARQNLPAGVFEFLGVASDADMRSVLQVFIDNCQDVWKKVKVGFKAMETSHSKWTKVRCSFCQCDVDLTRDLPQCKSAVVVLPCKHTFHRKCVFQWLRFQIHCPVCGARFARKVLSTTTAQSETQCGGGSATLTVIYHGKQQGLCGSNDKEDSKC